jgi:hypothetical protein
MPTKTTVSQRIEIYCQRQQGKSYSEIVGFHRLSMECTRYRGRRHRDGQSVQTVYPQRGLLRGSNPKVRYSVLLLRLEHPLWGPNRILNRLCKRPSL